MAVKRINITLPEELLETLDKKLSERERSSVIAEALELYMRKKSMEEIVQEMIEGYKNSYQNDLEMNQEWNLVASPRKKYEP